MCFVELQHVLVALKSMQKCQKNLRLKIESFNTNFSVHFTANFVDYSGFTFLIITLQFIINVK